MGILTLMSKLPLVLKSLPVARINFMGVSLVRLKHDNIFENASTTQQVACDISVAVIDGYRYSRASRKIIRMFD